MTAVAYPSAIARACSALDEVSVFRDLPDGYFRVVVRIIKKINLSRLAAPIVASRGTLANESGKSVETVGRAVKWLEDRGLIQRTQKARAGLRGSSSPLVPTLVLLEALLLTAPPRETMPALSESASGDTGTSAPSHQPSDQTPLNQHSKQPKGIQPQGGPFTRIGDISIPRELVWLHARQGLAPTAILALMRLARNAKQRLSDVVAMTRDYLLPLRGGNLFAYLRALLTRDKDYGYLARQADAQSQEDRKRARIEEKRRSLAGREFSTRDGKVIVFVETSGILTEIRDGRRAARPMDWAFVEAVDEGRLLPYCAREDES